MQCSTCLRRRTRYINPPSRRGDYAPLLLRLADDPALCRRIAESAARDIPVYSWAEIAAQFESFFDSL